MNKLRNLFPELIRTREAVLQEIKENVSFMQLFHEWTEVQQELFFDFCTGVRGVNVLYNGFFKEVFSPEYTSDRLEKFLLFSESFIASV